MDIPSPTAAATDMPAQGEGVTKRNRWDAVINLALAGTVGFLALVYSLPIFTPSLYAMNSTHQFGTVPVGTPVKHTFTVRNLHPWPVRVVGVSSDCGCTRTFVGRTLPFTLKPLQSVEVATALDTNRKQGYIAQRIIVSTADNSNSAELVLSGNVEQEFQKEN